MIENVLELIRLVALPGRCSELNPLASVLHAKYSGGSRTRAIQSVGIRNEEDANKERNLGPPGERRGDGLYALNANTLLAVDERVVV
jgi:hypothetical protein